MKWIREEGFGGFLFVFECIFLVQLLVILKAVILVDVLELEGIK